MSKDYYKILGVDKSSSDDEIKKAYRKLAMQYHPDRGGYQEKFKEINEAYQVLSNPQKKAQYDRFGSADFNAGGFGGGQGGYQNADFNDFFSGGGFGFDGGMGDIFEDFFGQAFSQVQVEIKLSIAQAVLGTEVEFTTDGKEKISLKIPAGVQDGTQFRIPGKGKAYSKGRGDLIAIIRVGIPKRISEEERELYKKIAELEKKKKSWKFW